MRNQKSPLFEETANDFAPLQDAPSGHRGPPMGRSGTQRCKFLSSPSRRRPSQNEDRRSERVRSENPRPLGYAATRSALLERGSSRRIDSLACVSTRVYQRVNRRQTRTRSSFLDGKTDVN